MKYYEYLNLAKKVNNNEQVNKIILCWTIKKNLAWLYENLNFDAPINKAKNYLKFVKKYASGHPLAYIIGCTYFNNLNITVNKHVLIPRNETELLVAKTHKLAIQIFSINKRVKLLDLGTGSGCIALSFAIYQKNWEIIASDISKKALMIANTNVINYKINNIKLIKSNLFENLINYKFNIIICNPPYINVKEKSNYIKKHLKNEPKSALFARQKGLYFYNEILKQILNFTEKKFLIAFEIGYNQKTAIETLVNKYLNKKYEFWFEKDFSRNWRFLFIKSSIIS